MSDADMVSMFFLGLTGTGHCIGMCGPLVVAIPGQSPKFSAHLLYHLGRTVTYTITGCLMGGIGVGIAGLLAGSGADPLLVFSGIQILFSLAAAGFLFWFALSRFGLVPEPSWMTVASPDKAPGYRKAMQIALVQKRLAGMFLVGLAMGLLPCGLSFAAFARALAAQGPVHGGLLLVSFGLGTWPGLLLIGTGAAGLYRKYRKHSDILSGILMAGMAFSLTADAVFAIFG